MTNPDQELRHTPGPWTVELYGDPCTGSLVIHSDPDNRVCFLATPGRDEDRHRFVANSRLIAAAPEWLKQVCADVDSVTKDRPVNLKEAS